MDNKEWYTIKEIADELKVTKQAVRKRVDNLDSKLVSKGVDNKTILISAKGVEILRNKATHKVSNDSINVTDNFDSNVVTIQLLQDTLDTLKKQLEEKDEHIKELTKSLQYEQQKVKELMLLEDKQTAAEVQTVTEKETLISKWKKMFSK